MSQDAPSEMTGPYVQPSGLEVDFDRNITKLYEAITACNWDEAIQAAKANPKEAKTWVVRHYDEEDSEGGENEIMWRFLPLHSACARQPPADVIKALLHAYPDGAKCVDDQGMYALHYACGNQASREVIRMLLMSFPEAAKLTDPRGMLPIHYLACWGPSSISVVDMVLVANRDVAQARDEDGNTPLELAMEGEYPESNAVVSALKRWLENTGSSSVSTKTASTKTYSSNSKSTKTSSTPLSMSKSDEKKESEPEQPVILRSLTPVQTPSVSEAELKQLRQQEAELKQLRYTETELKQLRQEMSSMKKLHDAKENEWEARIQAKEAMFNKKLAELEQTIKVLTAENEESSEKCKQLENEHDESNRKIAELESELQEKESELEQVRRIVDGQNRELENAHDERDGLRQTLADLTDQHDKYKMRSELLGDRLGSLSASMYSMLEQQNVVLDAMNAREEQWAALSDLRREKMRELVALEEQEASEEVELKSCLMKQTREMEAIQAVIIAARQHNV